MGQRRGESLGWFRARIGLSFALGTGQGLGISGYFVEQEFEGYKAAQLDVFRFVDNAHASPPSVPITRSCEMVWPITALNLTWVKLASQ